MGKVVMDVIWRRFCVKYDLKNADLYVLSWVRVRQHVVIVDTIYVLYGACLFYVSCIDYVGVCLLYRGHC